MTRPDTGYALLAIVLLGLVVGACGSAGAPSGSASHVPSKIATSAAIIRGDSDGDDDSDPYEDRRVREYGHAAGPVESREITAQVMRYYEAAAAGDGTAACAATSQALTKVSTLIKLVPDEYTPESGAPAAHGKTCAQFVSSLFALNHQLLAEMVGTLQVTGVRIDGRHALALLGFKTMPERQIAVRDEHGAWRIDGLLDSELP